MILVMCFLGCLFYPSSGPSMVFKLLNHMLCSMHNHSGKCIHILVSTSQRGVLVAVRVQNMVNCFSSRPSVLYHFPPQTFIWPKFYWCWWDPRLIRSWPATSATARVSEISFGPGYGQSWSSATPFWEHTVWINRSPLEPDFVSPDLSTNKREKGSVFWCKVQQDLKYLL